MKTIKRILLVITLLMVVTGVSLYFFLPLDRIARRGLQKALGPDFTFDNITVSLAHIEVTNLHHKEPIIQVALIKAYPSILSLLKGRVVIRKIELESPYLSLRRLNDGQWNIATVFHEREGNNPPLLLRGIEVRNGKLDMWDDKAGKTPYKGSFYDIRLALDSPIPIFQPETTEMKASGKIGGRREGRFTINARWDRKVNAVRAHLLVEGLDMLTLRPYLEERGGVEIRDGLLTLSTEVRYEKGIVNAPVEARVKGLVMKAGHRGTVLDVSVPLLKALIEKGGEVTLRFTVYGPLGDLRTDIRSALEKEVFQSIQGSAETPKKGVRKRIMDVFR